MGRLPRLRLFTGGPVRTGSLVALVVVLFPAATLAMAGLGGDDLEGDARVVARSPTPPSSNEGAGPEGVFKLDHLIFIVQENRSFDHYFGTYPGADGLEMVGGVPTNCVPDPVVGRDSCVYHTSMDDFNGGPHSRPSALTAINGG
ncbi:MAG TPA: alkaline phosphatase family protein, partial [Actinomycetota bacterium]|nr:alkaline phosphatase family protein [Actinomycetota bacterium]